MERLLKIFDGIILGGLFGFAVFSMFSISLSQISWGLGVLFWIGKVALTRSWKEVKLPLLVPILIFILACCLAVVLAPFPETSYKPLKKLLQFLVFFWVVNNVRDVKLRDNLILIVIGMGCLAALNGFYQAWTQEISLKNRIDGTLSTYMTFAGLLMIVGLFALGRYLFRLNKEGWVLTAFVFMTVCLLLTLTRQAWFGWVIGSTILLFCWKRLFVFAIPIVVILVLFFPPAPVKNRIQSMVNLEDASLQIRMSLWRGGWEIFKDYPVTGCGFKCVDVVHRQYPDPGKYLGRFKGLHNNLLQLAVDTGVLGLGAWLSIWMGFFMALWKKNSAMGKGHPDRWIVMASVGAVAGFLAGGLFEVNFYDSEVVTLLYFVMALPFTSPVRETSGS